MAKMTIKGVTYEGTPEELREIVQSIEEVSGEGASDAEQLITFKGGEYSLVDREARGGDVVVITEEGISDLYLKGQKYLVWEGCYLNQSLRHSVYRGGIFNRTKSNVLVYEKVGQALKVGDKVEVIDGRKSRYGDLVTGTLGEITGIELDKHYKDEPFRIESIDDYDLFPAEALRKLSAEEAQKAEPFAKAGRKMDEFKEGDIVRVNGDNVRSSRNLDGDIGTIARTDESSTPFEVIVKGRDKYDFNGAWHSAESLELIAPVESRVDKDV